MKEKNDDTYSMDADGSGELKTDISLFVGIAASSKDCVKNNYDTMGTGIDTASNSNESGSGNEDGKRTLASAYPEYLKSPQQNSARYQVPAMTSPTKLNMMNESIADAGAVAVGEYSFGSKEASGAGGTAGADGIIPGVYTRNVNSPKIGNTTPSEVGNGAASASMASTTAKSPIMDSIKGAASSSDTNNISNNTNMKQNNANQPKFSSLAFSHPLPPSQIHPHHSYPNYLRIIFPNIGQTAARTDDESLNKRCLFVIDLHCTDGYHGNTQH